MERPGEQKFVIEVFGSEALLWCGVFKSAPGGVARFDIAVPPTSCQSLSVAAIDSSRFPGVYEGCQTLGEITALVDYPPDG